MLTDVQTPFLGTPLVPLKFGVRPEHVLLSEGDFSAIGSSRMSRPRILDHYVYPYYMDWSATIEQRL